MDLRKIYLITLSLICINCSNNKKEPQDEVFNFDTLINRNLNNKEFLRYIDISKKSRLKNFRWFSRYSDSSFKYDIDFFDAETGNEIKEINYEVRSNRPKPHNIIFLEALNQGFKKEEILNILDIKDIIPNAEEIILYGNPGDLPDLQSIDFDTIISRISKPMREKVNAYGGAWFNGFKNAKYELFVKSEGYDPFYFEIDGENENYRYWTAKEKYAKPVDYFVRGANKLEYIVKLSKEDPFKNKVVRKY